MKTKRPNQIPNAQASEALGIINNSYVRTPVLPFIHQPGSGNKFYKIVDTEGLDRYFTLSLLISASEGNTNSLATHIFNYSGHSSYDFHGISPLNYSRGDNLFLKHNILYLKEGHRMRLWLEAGFFSVVCITGNYQPTAILDTPPSDATSLI